MSPLPAWDFPALPLGAPFPLEVAGSSKTLLPLSWLDVLAEKREIQGEKRNLLSLQERKIGACLSLAQEGRTKSFGFQESDRVRVLFS